MRYNSTNIPPEVIASLPAEVQEQVPFYDETKQPLIRASISVCLVVAYITLVLRLYARYVAKQALGLDDLFTGLAVLFTTASIGLMAYLTELGVGRRVIVMILEHLEDFDVLNRVAVASMAMYLPIIFCVKASALFLYRRLFPNRCLHIICYVLLTFTALYTLAGILALTIPCLPPRPATPEQPMARMGCPNDYVEHAQLVILITNVILDAIIICLPLPLIWRLQTTIRKKLQLTVLFTLGSLIFVLSILRVVTVEKLTQHNNTWDSIDVQLWSIAESAVSILAVSLPVMRPALRQIIYRKDGSLRFGRKQGTTSFSQEKVNKGHKRISILTFGRSRMKGPSGRQPQGDLTTIATATLADTTRNGSDTRLVVTENRGSRDSEFAV